MTWQYHITQTKHKVLLLPSERVQVQIEVLLPVRECFYSLVFLLLYVGVFTQGCMQRSEGYNPRQ